MKSTFLSRLSVPRLSPPFPWLLVVGFWMLPLNNVSATSLWTSSGSSERSLCADRKASRVGDIITVLVSESANQTSSQEKKTSNDSSVDASVSQFLFPSTVSKFGTSKGAMPGVKFGGKNAFTGSGAVTNSQSISATAAVVVTEVLPNGNLVIEGVRRVTFSGETQHIVLHGIVRPDDISSANTVASSSIAGARLEFVSEGDLASASKKGWINRLYEILRPF